MEDYKEFIDFLVGLASGEFDPEHLYRMGYPIEYSLVKETSEFIKERVLLEAHGSLPLFDNSATPIMQIGICSDSYGTGNAYIPTYEASPLLTQFFRESIDLKQLHKEFQDSAELPPLLKMLAESGVNVAACSLGSEAWIVIAQIGKSLPGYAAITYERDGEEKHVPKDIGELIRMH